MGAFRLLLFAVLISNSVCFLDDYRGEDFDLRDDTFVRRQTVPEFFNKHVVVADATIENATHWNELAKNRLKGSYCKYRPRQTFIRVKSLNEIFKAFEDLSKKCPLERKYNHYKENGEIDVHYESNKKFDVIDMACPEGGSEYSVSYKRKRYICSSVDYVTLPSDFEGVVEPNMVLNG